MLPESWNETQPGVFYTDRRIVVADQEAVAFLKSAAAASPLRRARLCTHPSPDSTQHDMIIVSHSRTYVPPHRHLKKSETFMVLEGHATMIQFENDGRVAGIFDMAPIDAGGAFFYRMSAGTFHSQVIHDEWLVFAESTAGPFASTESENADWAPPQNEPDAGRDYLRKILASMRTSAN